MMHHIQLCIHRTESLSNHFTAVVSVADCHQHGKCDSHQFTFPTAFLEGPVHGLYICNQCCCCDTSSADTAGMGTQKSPTRAAHLWRWCSSPCWASCTKNYTQSSRIPQNSAHSSRPWLQLTQMSLLQLWLQSLHLLTRQAMSLVLLPWTRRPILLCICQLTEKDSHCQLAAPVPKSLSLLKLSN